MDGDEYGCSGNLKPSICFDRYVRCCWQAEGLRHIYNFLLSMRNQKGETASVTLLMEASPAERERSRSISKSHLRPCQLGHNYNRFYTSGKLHRLSPYKGMLLLPATTLWNLAERSIMMISVLCCQWSTATTPPCWLLVLYICIFVCMSNQIIHLALYHRLCRPLLLFGPSLFSFIQSAQKYVLGLSPTMHDPYVMLATYSCK